MDFVFLFSLFPFLFSFFSNAIFLYLTSYSNKKSLTYYITKSHHRQHTAVPVRRMGRTGGKKLWPQQSEVSLATSSPVITETPLAAAAASKDALRSRADLRSRCSPPAVMATPVKGGGMERTGLMPETPEKSIYERLGWDEDDELAI